MEDCFSQTHTAFLTAEQLFCLNEAEWCKPRKVDLKKKKTERVITHGSLGVHSNYMTNSLVT